ncbi:hypothetical protein ACIQTX_14485 [Microbacterium sp. NPDC090281]|uniref:hypothetical protein n=1 Tax=Microbacterium sp. NPDC090281 TaxID=3364208 RepID=UPI00382B3310
MGNAKNEKRKRREQRAIIEATEFWHGGAAGREPGDTLLSPLLTHDPTSVSTTGMPEARADRVYFTTDRELARVYASIVQTHAGASAVYRVLPLGELERDPDYPTVGFQSAKASVLEVVERDVVMSVEERGIRCQPYELYTDGRNVHDETGRLQLAPGWDLLGFDQKYIDNNFAPWTSYEDAGLQLLAASRRSGSHTS